MAAGVPDPDPPAGPSPLYRPALAVVGPVVAAIDATYVGWLLLGFGMLVLRYRRAPLDERRRIRLLLLGMRVGIVLFAAQFATGRLLDGTAERLMDPSFSGRSSWWSRSGRDGGSVVDPQVVGPLVTRRVRLRESPLARLTAWELDVRREMAQGHGNARIGAALSLSESSVEKYVNSIFAKLGLSEQQVHRRVVAVLRYLRDGPLRAPE